MFRRFFAPALVSVISVLLAADFAHAQWRRCGGGYYDGRGGWGAPVGSVYFGAQPHFGSYYGPAYYGLQYGSPYYGSYSGSRSTSSYNPPSSDDRGSTNRVQRTSYYYSPETETPVQPSNGSATIRVIVPEPDARIYVEGKLMQQRGTDRTFNTPALDAGFSNTYHIRAIWIRNGRNATQEHVVNVTPGATTVVEFR